MVPGHRAYYLKGPAREVGVRPQTPSHETRGVVDGRGLGIEFPFDHGG